jgi:hypothetical protein
MPLNKFGRTASNARRRLGLALAVTLSGVSIIAYIAISITENAPAPTVSQTFDWIAVVQPTTESHADKVTLDAQAILGTSPEIGYEVTACGPHPYTAYLLLGISRSIRLFYADQIPSGANISSPLPSRIRHVSIRMQQTLQNRTRTITVPYGEVEQVSVKISDIFPCGASPTQQDEIFANEPFPPPSFQKRWVGPFGLWHGPRITQSWPLVGGDGAGPLMISGSPGKWVPPTNEHVDIRESNFSPNWSIGSAVPTPSLTNVGPVWSSRTAIAPTAEFIDTPSTALLEDWVVIIAICFGIGGALLASLLVDWLRLGLQPDNDSSNKAGRATEQQEVHPGQSSASKHSRLALIGTIFIIVYAIRSRHRRSA